jgi:serine protease Do
MSARFVFAVLFFLGVGAPRALAWQVNLNKEIQALQEQVHQLIESTEASVACIAVSRSEDYRDYGLMPSPDEPGKLGIFDANPHRHLLDPFNVAPNKKLQRLDLSDPDTVPDSYGSGVVIDSTQGLILTNHHVIRDATKIYVRLPGGKGSWANIHAADGRSDLAVLKLINVPPRLKAVKFGDGGKLRKGDFVVSLANPFSVGFRDGSPSASWGMISNLRRRAPGPPREVERNRPLSQYQVLVQTDARLNLGCSGGGLFNLDGEMVALTTSTAAIQGGESAGGFALPLDKNTQRLIQVLKRGEEVEYGFLGIMLGGEGPFEPANGIAVGGATPGLPAARAGLKQGDIITSINGTPVKDFDDLFLTVGAQLAGTEVTLDVHSNFGNRKVTLRLAKANWSGLQIASKKREAVFGIRVDYTSVLMQGTSVTMPTGVLIREIQKNTPAAQKIEPKSEGNRMVITHVNAKPVTDPSEFYEAVKNKTTLELRVVDVVPNFDSTQRTIKLP